MTEPTTPPTCSQRPSPAQPTGVWSSPGRVNLIGEHTDYTGGYVMPFAIGQRAYVAARPRADRIVRAVAAGQDVDEVDLDDVGTGRPAGWLGYLAGAAWVAEQCGATGDRAGARLGSGRSSRTCPSAPASRRRPRSPAPPCWHSTSSTGGRSGATELARWGQRVENVIVGTPCGIMDQSASLLCQEGSLLFLDTESGAVEHVHWLSRRRRGAARHEHACAARARRRAVRRPATPAARRRRRSLGVPSLRHARPRGPRACCRAPHSRPVRLRPARHHRERAGCWRVRQPARRGRVASMSATS